MDKVCTNCTFVSILFQISPTIDALIYSVKTMIIGFNSVKQMYNLDVVFSSQFHTACNEDDMKPPWYMLDGVKAICTALRSWTHKREVGWVLLLCKCKGLYYLGLCPVTSK